MERVRTGTATKPGAHAGRGLALAAAVTTCASGAVVAATPGLQDAAVRADQQFATYAYAHEFGSGLYDFGGRTLQVYTLPIAWSVRPADARGPGVRLRLPVTLGFLDFQPADVLSTGLPDEVDSLSVVPGVELEWRLAPSWTLRPYAQAGASVADETDVETTLFGAGLGAEHRFAMPPYAGTYAAQLAYSGVHYRGDLPDDDFVRWRNGVELRRPTAWQLGGRPVEATGFTIVDVYLDAPTGPATGVDVPEVQLEVGIVWGTQPMPTLLGWPLPRLGLSYRYAGDVSSVRVVIGAPF